MSQRDKCYNCLIEEEMMMKQSIVKPIIYSFKTIMSKPLTAIKISFAPLAIILFGVVCAVPFLLPRMLGMIMAPFAVLVAVYFLFWGILILPHCLLQWHDTGKVSVGVAFKEVTRRHIERSIGAAFISFLFIGLSPLNILNAETAEGVPVLVVVCSTIIVMGAMAQVFTQFLGTFVQAYIIDRGTTVWETVKRALSLTIKSDVLGVSLLLILVRTCLSGVNVLLAGTVMVWVLWPLGALFTFGIMLVPIRLYRRYEPAR